MQKKTRTAARVMACALSAVMIVGSVSVMPANVAAAEKYDYGDALSKSLLFYQLQEAGTMSEETLSRCNWKGDSCEHDGQDVGLDLSGGWYDAGDNAKFNLPMAYSSMLLGWSYLNNPEAYKNSGQEKWMLHDLKWANDYFVKCNPDAHTYYYQVGNGGHDHAFWSAAECVEAALNTTAYASRPSYKVGDETANGGTGVTAEAASSLAVASMVFKDSDPELSEQYLEHARTLFTIANKARSEKGYTMANGYYSSFNGFWDELGMAACWLYEATGEKTYLNVAEECVPKFGTEDPGTKDQAYSWPLCWDDVHLAANLKLAEFTGKKEYYEILEKNIDFWLGRISGSHTITYSPKGLAVCDTWGSARYACNEAFLCFMYAELPDANASYKKDATKFAEQQINYVLGDGGHSYQVGFGKDYPVNPHHRTAHGSWLGELTKLPKTNRHLLVGALVGGPASADDDDYEDTRSNYQTNEVACDYNAAFTGDLAIMYDKYSDGKRAEDASAIETPDGEEYLVTGLIQSQNSSDSGSSVEVMIHFENRTAWPAVPTDSLVVRTYLDISDVLEKGYKPSDIKTSTNFAQGSAVISELKPTGKNGIYYCDLDLTGTYILPAGESLNNKEFTYKITAPCKWKYTNSPSLKDLLKTDYNHQADPVNIAFYNRGVLVHGQEYSGSGAATPTPTPRPTESAGGEDPVPEGDYGELEGTKIPGMTQDGKIQIFFKDDAGKYLDEHACVEGEAVEPAAWIISNTYHDKNGWSGEAERYEFIGWRSTLNGRYYASDKIPAATEPCSYYAIFRDTEAPATPTPTKKPTVTPKPTATAKPTVKPTATPKPTATAKPTAKPTATPKPTATVKPTTKPTATPKPTATAVPTTKPGTAKVKLVAKNLELQGKIGATLYADVTGDLTPEDVYVVTTINGEEIESVVKTSGSRLVITTFVKPKELHDEITLEFRRVDNDKVLKLTTGASEIAYSVADIAEMYQGASYSREIRELAEAIQNFGSYAQKLLKYDTATAKVTDLLGDVTKADVSPYKTVTSGKVSGLKFQGTGLELNADTVLKAYFSLTGEDDIADYSFTLDGKKVTPEKIGDSRYSISIEGIKAKDLGKNYEISVKKSSSKMEIQTSVLSWSEQVIGRTGVDAATTNMAKMIYRYSEKARLFRGNGG